MWATGIPKKDNTSGIEGETTLTAFRKHYKHENTDRSSAEVTEVPPVSTHLMMAE
jgi:hypothetical protein